MTVQEAHALLLDGKQLTNGSWEIWEDFIYTRKKSLGGMPEFRRILAMQLYADGDWLRYDEPFDGTFASFYASLLKWNNIDEMEFRCDELEGVTHKRKDL